jgi:outer membrane protein assembly factor BamD (BamD/ComL family)
MRNLLALSVLAILIFIIGCSDKKSEKGYFDLGYENYNNEKYEEALTNFNSILEYYPEGEFASKAMFMAGFISANHLENLDEAKKYYEMFINKYPEHELVDSAKYELETLGKDIEDLPIFQKIEEEEQKEAQETTK